MDTNFEQKVRERAYEIWVSAGMADGNAHEHWVLAEEVVANEAGTSVASEPAMAASPMKRSVRKVAAKKSAKVAKAH